MIHQMHKIFESHRMAMTPSGSKNSRRKTVGCSIRDIASCTQLTDLTIENSPGIRHPYGTAHGADSVQSL